MACLKSKCFFFFFFLTLVAIVSCKFFSVGVQKRIWKNPTLRGVQKPAPLPHHEAWDKPSKLSISGNKDLSLLGKLV